MAKFAYSAISPSGKLVKGELDGHDEAGVIEQLHAQGLLPVGATLLRTTLSRRGSLAIATRRPLPLGELALFSNQLARLLKADLPLDRALDLLTTLVSQPRMKRATARVLAAVRDGSSLVEAMATEGKGFPAPYISMVRAGEGGSALQLVLARLADFLVRSEAIRQRVLSALIYPAILTVVAGISVTVVLTVVLPEFEPLFKDAGTKLPPSTRLIIAFGDVVRTYWWALLAGPMVLAVGWSRLMQIPELARSRDRGLLLAPLLRDLIVKFEIGRFSRTLGVLLANGVPAARALALCAGVVGNRAIAEAIETASVQLKEGEGLSEPLRKSGRFPILPIQMIRIGEETGKLEDMLHEIAEIYDHDVQRLLDRLLALLVPTITIVMGGLIAAILASIMVAMMSMNDLVN